MVCAVYHCSLNSRWLVWSRLNGSFCLFAPKLWEGCRDLWMIFCQCVNTLWIVITLIGGGDAQICLNCLYSEAVRILKSCSHVLAPLNQWATKWNFRYLIFSISGSRKIEVGRRPLWILTKEIWYQSGSHSFHVTWHFLDKLWICLLWHFILFRLTNILYLGYTHFSYQNLKRNDRSRSILL